MEIVAIERRKVEMKGEKERNNNEHLQDLQIMRVSFFFSIIETRDVCARPFYIYLVIRKS